MGDVSGVSPASPWEYQGRLPAPLSVDVHYSLHSMTTTSMPTSPVELLEFSRLAEAKEKGFALFAINSDGVQPGFVYSIGMAQHDLPELLCYFSEGMGVATLGLLSNICPLLIESGKRFGRIPTIRTFCSKQFVAHDPDVTYQPTFLQGDSYMYALKTVVTRAVRYRKELGMPQVIELRHDDVPTIDGVRAQLMLQAS